VIAVAARFVQLRRRGVDKRDLSFTAAAAAARAAAAGQLHRASSSGGQVCRCLSSGS